MVVRQPSKLVTWVRFPSPAPNLHPVSFPAMTTVLVAAAAAVVGILIGRWWVAGVAGLVALVTTFLATASWGAGDSPFIYVGVLVVAITSIGILARRRLRAAR